MMNVHIYECRKFSVNEIAFVTMFQDLFKNSSFPRHKILYFYMISIFLVSYVLIYFY